MARLNIAVFPDCAYIPLADFRVTGFGGQLPLVVAVHFLFFTEGMMMMLILLWGSSLKLLQFIQCYITL